MKTCLLALALLAGAAHAAPMAPDRIANMQAQNDFVMLGGLCAVANGPKPKPGSKMTVLLGGQVHVIDAAAAYRISSVAYAKNKKTGRYLMSERFGADCKKDANSDGCIFARAKWSQEPLSIHMP